MDRIALEPQIRHTERWRVCTPDMSGVETGTPAVVTAESGLVLRPHPAPCRGGPRRLEAHVPTSAAAR